MISCRRPSNRSRRLTGPSGPSKRYSFPTAIHGIRRRLAASASRARVSFFSSTSSCSRAASHSCGDTIGGVFIVACPPSDTRRRCRTGAPQARLRSIQSVASPSTAGSSESQWVRLRSYAAARRPGAGTSTRTEPQGPGGCRWLVDPAGHGDVGAGDVAVRGRPEQQYRLGYVVGNREPPGWCSLPHGLADLVAEEREVVLGDGGP